MNASIALDEGLAVLGLDLSAMLRAKLLGYLALMRKWNRTYNLTAIRDEPGMVTHHLLDSLSVLPLLLKAEPRPRRLFDVGSGAGLPGIPLAIASPDLEVTLVEVVEKKSAFQRQVKIELELENVNITTARVETLVGGACDAVISRAFADLTDFVRLAGHLPVSGGLLYAMKGHATAAESSGLPAPWHVHKCHPLRVPGLDAQRHLIVLESL